MAIVVICAGENGTFLDDDPTCHTVLVNRSHVLHVQPYFRASAHGQKVVAVLCRVPMSSLTTTFIVIL